jgi:hypothetical protein
MIKLQVATATQRGRAFAVRTERVLRVSPYVIGILLSLVGFAALMRMIALDDIWPRGTDLAAYLDAAKAIRQGGSPYTFDVDHDPNAHDPYAYPPLFAELVAALTTVLGYGNLWIIWSIFCLGCLIGSIFLMLRGFGPKTDYRWVFLIAGVAMTGRMVRGDAYHGQINFLLLLLLLLGLKQLLSGRITRASAAWAVMIVFKPFMGIVVLYLLRRRFWKPAMLTVAFASVLFMASFLLVYPNAIETFAGWMQTSHWYTSLPFVAKPGNQSFYGLFMRLFAVSRHSDEPKIVGALMLPIVGLALATFLFAVPSQPSVRLSSGLDDGPRALLEVGVTLALALSCGPLMEGDHVFVVLPGLFGAAMLAQNRMGGSSQHRILWLSAVIAWCVALCAVVPPLTVKFLEPYTWSIPLSGLKILGTGRVCTTLFVAAILSAAALWQDRKFERVFSWRTEQSHSV